MGKTKKSDRKLSDPELLELEARHCSWGDTVHYAKELNIFTRCEGSYLYDDKGTPFLDLQMWYSAATFGYNHPRLKAALVKQIETLPQLACQYLHKEKILLSTRIAQDAQKKFGAQGRVHFNVGGASAIEDAIKVVRNHTKKNPVFAFMGSYHGRTLGATAITSSYRYREKFGHFGDRANFVPYPYCFRCPLKKDKETCNFECLRQFERLFESEYYSLVNTKTRQCEFGAFFVEPVQATGGYIIPPKGYFKELKKILDRYKILLVDDEIQMGFCRTGKLWAIEHFDVTPDIMVLGKALTNGLNPISAIWAKEELISPEVFPPGSTHATFSSNPLGTAVGLEVMTMIEESDFEKTVPQKGRYFVSALKALQKKYPQVGEVDGLGLAIRIEMCQKDGFTPNRELTDAIMNIGLSGQLTSGGKKRGLVLDVGGYYKNVFTLAPSLDITEKEIDLGVALFEEALAKGLVATA
ncbi:MAG: aspartate aminotransferase family protein [Candidatus Omnitrophica bacterium]|nr:aspartate aminotransferase family protein [Candidatus Omnitrophota bacterium]